MKPGIKTAVACSLILLVYLLSMNPGELPSVLLIVPFALLFIVIFLVVASIVGHYGVTGPKRIRLSVVIAIAPALLLVLQSLGQLTVRDTVAMFALFGVTYFYIVRLDVRPTQ